MNSILRKSLGLVLVLFIMVLGLSNVVKVRATDNTATILFDGSGLTSTLTTEDTTITVNGFQYVVSSGAKSTAATTGSNRFNTTTACLIGKTGKYIYNTTAFEHGIRSFEIYSNSNASTNVSVGVYFSNSVINAYDANSENTWKATLSTANCVYDCSDKIPTGAKYFWYQVTNNYNSQVEFRITYNTCDNDHCFALFDANGGSGTMNPLLVGKSVSTALTNCSFTPPTGKEFDGWATTPNGAVVYQNGTDISINTTTVLYAKWKVSNAGATITFNSNNANSETSEQSVTKNTDVTLDVNAFDGLGLKFTGWNTLPNGTGTPYEDGDTINISEDLTLYAQWNSIYTIAETITEATTDKLYRVSGEVVSIIDGGSFVLQSGTNAILIFTTSISSSVALGNQVTLTGQYSPYNGNPELKTITDLVVTDDDDTIDATPLTSLTEVVAANKMRYIELSNLFITNVTTDNKERRISISYNGENQTTVLYVKDIDYCANNELFVANKYINIKGVVYFKNSTKQVLPIFVEQPTQYSVTFNSNGGSSVATQYVIANTKANEPAEPTKEANINNAYEFGGWYTDNNTFNNSFDFDSNINNNVTLYAKWNTVALPSYVIFSGLSTKVSLKVDYVTSGGNVLASGNFVGTASSQTELPTGWSGDVGGTYQSPFYQSFRNNKKTDYVVSPLFSSQSSVVVSIEYYLNNQSAEGSSKLKFTAYDEDDHELGFITSSELNDGEVGVSNSKVLKVTLTYSGIRKIKIEFVKDSGRNIAFSNITVSVPKSFTFEQDTSHSNKNLLSMRFAGIISAELKERLDADNASSYGVFYAKASSLSETTLSAEIAKLNAGTLTLEQLTSAGIKHSTTLAANLTGVNEAGTEEVDNNPSYYQFGVSINNISDANIETVINAAAYVCLDGTYYIMSVRAFSAATLAEAYLSAGDTSSYTEHLDMLEWLSEGAN